MGSGGVFVGSYLSDNHRWEGASSRVGYCKLPHASNVGVGVVSSHIVSLCDVKVSVCCVLCRKVSLY